MVRTVWSFNIQKEATKGNRASSQKCWQKLATLGCARATLITYLSLRRLEFNFKAFAKALAPATPMSFPRKLSGQARSLRCRDRLGGDTAVPPNGCGLVWTVQSQELGLMEGSLFFFSTPEKENLG